LGEGEEGGLGGEVGGFEVLGDLIESLSNPGVVAAHVGGWMVGMSGINSSATKWSMNVRDHSAGVVGV